MGLRVCFKVLYISIFGNWLNGQAPLALLTVHLILFVKLFQTVNKFKSYGSMYALASMCFSFCYLFFTFIFCFIQRNFIAVTANNSNVFIFGTLSMQKTSMLTVFLVHADICVMGLGKKVYFGYVFGLLDCL